MYLNSLHPSTGSNVASVGSDGPIVSGEVDREFLNDFDQASRDWRDCVQLRQPLFQPTNRVEFMTLVVILEEGAPCYAVRDVRKLIERRFGCEDINPKNLLRTLKTLDIQRPRLEP